MALRLRPLFKCWDLNILRPIFALSRNCHILGLISPECGQIRPQIFTFDYAIGTDLKNVKKSPILWGITWAGSPVNIEKIAKVQYCGGYGSNVHTDMDPGIGSFCGQASLLMYTLNLALRCRIVPSMGRRPGEYQKLPLASTPN